MLWRLKSAAESEARLRQEVTYLASDALEGRGVGTAGLNKAADYVADQFAANGAADRSLSRHAVSGIRESRSRPKWGRLSRIVWHWSGRRRMAAGSGKSSLSWANRSLRWRLGEAGTFNAPLVFAGYGITAKNLKRGNDTFTYDDYAGIDAKGKVVIILRKEPQQKDKNSPFNGTQTTQYAYFTRKLDNAIEHGAAAVIFVNDELELASHREENAKLLKAALDKLDDLRQKFSAASPTDAATEKLAGEISKAAAEASELSKALAAAADGLLPFAGAAIRARIANCRSVFVRGRRSMRC